MDARFDHHVVSNMVKDPGMYYHIANNMVINLPVYLYIASNMIMDLRLLGWPEAASMSPLGAWGGAATPGQLQDTQYFVHVISCIFLLYDRGRGSAPPDSSQLVGIVPL